MDDYYYEDPTGYTGGTDSSFDYIPPYYAEDPSGYSGGTENTGTTYVPPNYVEDPYGYTGGTESNAPARGNLVQTPTFDILKMLKSLGGKAFDYASQRPGQLGLMALLAALGAANKAPPSGGGVAKRYVGPSRPLARTITEGKYGPIAKYAAHGGIMHAYAQGGQVKPVAMEDGGFVMTKRAVDGAGGPQGIQSLLPGARPIRGPGTGTSDSIPAYIQGNNGVTPARVSNGEAYIPRRAQPPGGTRELYAMMRQLERRA